MNPSAPVTSDGAAGVYVAEVAPQIGEGGIGPDALGAAPPWRQE